MRAGGASAQTWSVLGCAARHVPQDTGHGIHLNSWAARCQVDENRIILPLLNRVGRTGFREEKGLVQGQLRKKGNRAQVQTGVSDHLFLPVRVTSLLPPSNPHGILSQLIMLIIPEY